MVVVVVVLLPLLLPSAGSQGGADAHAGGVVGSTLIKMGKPLHEAMRTEKGAAAAYKASALAEGVHITWPEEERRRRDQVWPTLPCPPPHMHAQS